MIDHFHILSELQFSDDTDRSLEILESLKDHISQISYKEIVFSLLNEYALNSNMDPRIRISAMEVIQCAIREVHYHISEEKEGTSITRALIEVVAVTHKEGTVTIKSELGMDDENPQQAALKTLAEISLYLPASEIFTPIYSGYWFSGDIHHQYAVLESFLYISPPHHLDAIRLGPKLIPWFIKGLSSQSHSVQLAAMHALLGLSQFPLVLQNHLNVFIPLVNACFDRIPEMNDDYCELYFQLFMHLFTGEYVLEIIPRILLILRVSSKPQLQGAVLQLISSCADVTKTGFTPLLKQTVEAIYPFMQTNQQINSLQVEENIGYAFTAMQALCSAVGPEQFGPYLQPLIKNLMELISSSNDFKDFFLAVLVQTIKATGPKIEAHVELIVHPLFRILDSNSSDFDEYYDVEHNRSLCLKALALLWQLARVDSSHISKFHDQSVKYFTAYSTSSSEFMRTLVLDGLWGIYVSNFRIQEKQFQNEVVMPTYELLKESKNLLLQMELLIFIIEAVQSCSPCLFNTGDGLLTNVLMIVKRDTEFLIKLSMLYPDPVFLNERIVHVLKSTLNTEEHLNERCQLINLTLEVAHSLSSELMEYLFILARVVNKLMNTASSDCIYFGYDTLQSLIDITSNNATRTGNHKQVSKSAVMLIRLLQTAPKQFYVIKDTQTLISKVSKAVLTSPCSEDIPLLLLFLAQHLNSNDILPLLEHVWENHIEAVLHGTVDPLGSEEGMQTYQMLKMQTLQIK